MAEHPASSEQQFGGLARSGERDSRKGSFLLIVGSLFVCWKFVVCLFVVGGFVVVGCWKFSKNSVGVANFC